MAPQRLDVAILGGGMAGSLLARQLVRAHPELRIGLFEKKTQHSHSVGESMVEIASHYFIRRLGLSSYLYDRQYPKNGLRFFFDSPEKDLPLHEMSEIGSSAIPFLPAFQVDRSRLETDLLEMDLRDGVLVRTGARVASLELSDGNGPHRLTVTTDGTSEPFESRWVVDASGRSQLIAREKGLQVPETHLANASVWGWFEGVTDIDALGPTAFRERVRYTARRLSTLHFVYRGYWIWFIPLQDGMTSIGVVCERRLYDPAWRSEDGLLRFLRGHAAVASLLENAKAIATRGYNHLAYGTRRFYSPQRWGLVGEAAAFPDPFYSPGADFIALGNDFVTDLVVRDARGEAEELLHQRTDLYDRFMRFRLEAAMHLYRDQYPFLGSYDLCKLKWDLDIGCYYNLWLSSYMLDQHLDERHLRWQLRQRKPVLAALSNFRELFQKLDAHLTARGVYHRHNRGAYSDGQDCLGFMRSLGGPTSNREVLVRTQEIFNAVRNRALDLLEDAPGAVARQDQPLPFFMGAAGLAP